MKTLVNLIEEIFICTILPITILIWDGSGFKKSDAIVSATLFGKLIQNPINEVFVNSAANDISYINSVEI